ncbi:MAG: AAA family ATPase [Firmicutes bacterium]|nr:AAA family ATPase [Bacillota bacterium]
MNKQPVTICFANNKGGSGKSTTCANIGYSLASMGYRVLLLDGDMQMNLSLSFFPEETVLGFAQSEKNLYYAIREQKSLIDYIVPTGYENLDLIPSSSLMSSMEYELFTKWQRELILRKCLQPVKDSGRYDFILLDAPPTLGGWVMNLLCASDHLLIPVEASPWGLFGLANMFEFFETVRQIAPEVSLLGIAVTKVDERKNYFRQTIETLREMENVHLFESYIHVDSSIEWAQDESKPVAAFRRSSRSAREYSALAKEVAEHVDR